MAFVGTRSGCNKPYGRWCGAFESLEISSMLLLIPKYPRDGRL